MFEIVSFDYFPIHEIFDFGFSETDPWSVNFGWLGYDSITFVEGMGSISLFFWISMLYFLIAALISLIKCLSFKCCPRCLKAITMMSAFHYSLSLVQGIFFETLICISVGMRMFKRLDYLEPADKFAIAWQMVCLVFLVAFTGFTIYFTFVMIPKIVTKKLAAELDQNK